MVTDQDIAAFNLMVSEWKRILDKQDRDETLTEKEKEMFFNRSSGVALAELVASERYGSLFR